jgi:hypothetical protein
MGNRAALFRSPGQVLAGRVAVLAAGQQGTLTGSCARIAGQLIAGQVQDAAQTAATMILPCDTRAEYDIGNELLDPAVLARPSSATKSGNCCHEASGLRVVCRIRDFQWRSRPSGPSAPFRTLSRPVPFTQCDTGWVITIPMPHWVRSNPAA